jgi:Putative zinc-finger
MWAHRRGLRDALPDAAGAPADAVAMPIGAVVADAAVAGTDESAPVPAAPDPPIVEAPATVSEPEQPADAVFPPDELAPASRAVSGYCREMGVAGSTEAVLGDALHRIEQSAVSSAPTERRMLRFTRAAVAVLLVDTSAVPSGWRGSLAAEHRDECQTMPRQRARAADGQLDPVERQALERHISGCLPCQAFDVRSRRAERVFDAAWHLSPSGDVSVPQMATEELPEGLVEEELAGPLAEPEPAPQFPAREASPLFPLEDAAPLFPPEDAAPLPPPEDTAPLLPREDTAPLLPPEDAAPCVPPAAAETGRRRPPARGVLVAAAALIAVAGGGLAAALSGGGSHHPGRAPAPKPTVAAVGAAAHPAARRPHRPAVAPPARHHRTPTHRAAPATVAHTPPPVSSSALRTVTSPPAQTAPASRPVTSAPATPPAAASPPTTTHSTPPPSTSGPGTSGGAGLSAAQQGSKLPPQSAPTQTIGSLGSGSGGGH